MGGDAKFRKVSDLANRCTRLLNLHLSPTSMARGDVCIVLKVAEASLTFLETVPNGVTLISGRYFPLGEKYYPFNEALRKIEQTWRTA
jgi:hypothetical protein